MKKYLFLSIILLCADILNAQVNSPWKWSYPTPQGNTISYVKVFSESTWYALGYSGTFMKTTNGGTNWFIDHEVMGKPQGLYQSDIYSGWFFDMNTGIACGTNNHYGKVSRTTNGGISWDTISLGFRSYYSGIHFINDLTGFMAIGAGPNILVTANGGLNWSTKGTGFSKPFFCIFALDADHIYIGSSNSSLIFTSNGGSSWIRVFTGGGEPATTNDVFFKDENTGWVCGGTGLAAVIRRTTNGGINWTELANELPEASLRSIVYDSGTLFVGGHELYIFRSTNDGDTWDSLFIKGNQYYSFTYYCLDKNASTMVTAGFDGLINSSTNSGANWTAHNYLGYSGVLKGIWCSNMNGKVIAVGGANPYPVIISSNGGSSWQFDAASNIGSNRCGGISMLNSNTGFVCGSSNKIFKTTDGGESWDSIEVTGPLTDFIALDFVNENTGFVTGSGDVFKTKNGGNSWSMLNIGEPVLLIYSIDMVDAHTGWFVGHNGTCRKTVNGGGTWSVQNAGNSTLYDIQMLNAQSGYLCGLSGKLMKTANGGDNWENVPNPLTGTFLGLISVSFINMNTGFVSGSSGYVMRTSDGGSSWQIYNTSDGTLYSVFAKGYDSAWVCGSGSVFKLYNSLVSAPEWRNKVPNEFILYQNYPNPFNPSTTIKFGLPKAGKVSFKVYDLTGKEVVSVFDNVELNAGTVTYVFDGSNYSGGVYFYRLETDEFIQTKKMVLVK